MKTVKFKYKGWKCRIDSRYPWKPCLQAFWTKGGKSYVYDFTLDTPIKIIKEKAKECIRNLIKQRKLA